MVEPVRVGLVAGALAAAVTWAVAAAAAEPLPAACERGLVLDPEGDAIVSAVCEVARARGSSGVVRASVVPAGRGRLRLTIARVADTSGAERVVHRDVAGVDEARRVTSPMLDELEGQPPRAPSAEPAKPVAPSVWPPPSEPPVSPPAGKPSVAEPLPSPPPGAPSLTAAEPEKDAPRAAAPAVEKKRRTFFPIGPQAFLAAPTKVGSEYLSHDIPVVYGGGGTIGVEHDRVLAYADLLFGAGEGKGTSVSETAISAAVRAGFLQGSVTPVLGGGFLLVSTRFDYDAPTRGGTYRAHESDTTMHLFAEGGAAVKLDEVHRLFAVARYTPLSSHPLATVNAGYMYAF